MNTEVSSKQAVISKAPYELYMTFVDMRNFKEFLPEGKKQAVTADFDSISGEIKGINIGVRVTERRPYSRIDFKDDNSPFPFNFSIFFDPVSNENNKTNFYIKLQAELNFMMKMMIGSKLQEGLDKIVDSLAAMSEGRMPEGFDKETLEKYKEKYNF